MRGCIVVVTVCLLAALTSTPARGQALFVTPTQTEFDQIDLLTGAQRSNRLSLEARTLFHFDTDVEDFARAGIHRPTPTVFDGSGTYFTSDQTQEIGIAKGPWQFSYAMEQAQLYRGNHDAAQLYLDSTSRTINLNGIYNPILSLNRSSGMRWRVNYESPVHLRKNKAYIQVAGNILSLSRAELGNLQGNTTNGKFNGVINLDTTNGLPADLVGSYGGSLDAGFSVAINPHWRASASVENLLGEVWQDHVQHILTNVVTNTLVPNSDGFLQGVPLLSGTVTQGSLQSDIQKRYHYGAMYQESGRDWMALLSYDFDWRLNLGVNLPMKHRRRVWALLCPSPIEWQLGYEDGGLRFQFGLSGIDIGTSQRATLQVGYRLFL